MFGLTEVKLEVLCQAAPAIFLGLHLPRLKAHAVLRGLWVGLAVTVGLLVANGLGLDVPTRPLGIHAGVWGLAANGLTIAALSRKSG